MTKKKSEGAAGAESTGAGVDPAIASMTYEQAVKALEELVSAIEQGEVGLEESLASYRRGEQLVRHCKALLDRAETTVRQLSVADLEQGAS
ncbi:MAG: exodeoxyribonuclease VII small subunit [Planctomycetota bacterium]|nr:exodeoxyribonuclease VII small subunit [Planctomycetota bacterium]